MYISNVLIMLMFMFLKYMQTVGILINFFRAFTCDTFVKHVNIYEVPFYFLFLIYGHPKLFQDIHYSFLDLLN